MPEVHYTLGGSPAAYTIRGRFGPKYTVTGDIGPLADSGTVIPNWKIGEGTIAGSGEFDVAYTASDDTDKNVAGEVIGVGQPVASGSVVLSNEGDIEGVGQGASEGTGGHTTTGTASGVGQLAASVTTSEGHDIVISGHGAPAATITTTRNTTGEIEAVGDTDADGAEDPAKTFLEMIQAVSADSGLLMCLDAAAIGSYPGSGQTWTDLTGNGNDFYRGANSSSESSDPTFNGTAGALTENEYFSHDGGDYFSDTGLQSWADDWHKNNAVWTMIGVNLIVAGAGTHPVFETGIASGSSAGQTIQIRLSTTTASPQNRQTNLHVRRNNNGVVLSETAFETGISQTMVFWAVAIDEATGSNGLTLQFNDLRQKFTSTYSSPSSSDPNGNYRMGRDIRNNSGLFTTTTMPNGSRTYVRAAWSRRLSDTEIDNIRSQLQSRYSALP